MIRSESKLYSSLPLLGSYKTWSEIDLDALRWNWRLLRRAVTSPDGHTPRMIAVVKADAYGHGADACAEALAAEGCDFFAVSCIEEAAALRAALRRLHAAADILILGFTFPTEARLLAENDIIQSVFSPEFAAALDASAKRAGVKVRVHVKLDTGMNRIGIAAQTDGDIPQAVRAVKEIEKMQNLSVEGMFTHFASADEPDETAVTPGLSGMQYDRFCRVRDLLARDGAVPACLHVCNTAAALRYPEYRMECVRIGLSLWGMYPSDLFNASYTCGEALRPVLQLKTRITQLHTLRPGETVSYGGHYSAPADRTIATIPIGYADGFIRAYTGAQVVVCTGKGEFSAPVAGNICMDQCMLDVTGIPASVGDEVVLFGRKPSQIAELARRAGTIPYECLCLLSARIPLVYRNAETPVSVPVAEEPASPATSQIVKDEKNHE